MVLNEQNKQPYNTLKRIITKFTGRFSLILVHCNDPKTISTVLKSLEQEREGQRIEYSILMLDPTTQSLHKTISKLFKSQPPQALIVVGLETVASIDDLLARANLTRNLFSKDFHFPLILWVTDETSKKLTRIATDFNSWGTSIHFTVA